MRLTLQFLFNLIIFSIFALGLVVFIFWRFNIFKKEPDLGEILKIKNKIDFVNNYPYQNLNNYFQNLQTTKFEIPIIDPEELGKSSLF
jgi:hypothetical protein